MAIETGYIAESVPFAELESHVILLTDGIRARKTTGSFIIEYLQSDDTWTASPSLIVLPTTDPAVLNALWLDGGIISVSQG